MTKYDDLIANLRQILKLNREREVLEIQLLEVALIGKHFDKKEGKFAIFKRKHFDKNYHYLAFSQNYKNSGFHANKYKTKPLKNIDEGDIVLIDLETHDFALDNVPELVKDKSVILLGRS